MPLFTDNTNGKKLMKSLVQSDYSTYTAAIELDEHVEILDVLDNIIGYNHKN